MILRDQQTVGYVDSHHHRAGSAVRVARDTGHETVCVEIRKAFRLARLKVEKSSAAPERLQLLFRHRDGIKRSGLFRRDKRFIIAVHRPGCRRGIKIDAVIQHQVRPAQVISGVRLKIFPEIGALPRLNRRVGERDIQPVLLHGKEHTVDKKDEKSCKRGRPDDPVPVVLPDIGRLLACRHPFHRFPFCPEPAPASALSVFFVQIVPPCALLFHDGSDRLLLISANTGFEVTCPLPDAHPVSPEIVREGREASASRPSRLFRCLRDRARADTSSFYSLPPDVAIPSTNCFWKMI